MSTKDVFQGFKLLIREAVQVHGLEILIAEVTGDLIISLVGPGFLHPFAVVSEGGCELP